MTPTYVYGILPAGGPATYGVAGVGEEGPIYSVSRGDLAALVSPSPRTDYRGLQRDEAVGYLMAHQRVVERVMQTSALLPVKFGTVLPDESWVRTLLEQGEHRFRAALERCAGRTQMEVVVLWDLQEVFQEIGAEEPIARLKAQVTTHAGEDTTAERITVGRLVQASLQGRLTALHARLLASLQEVGPDLVVNPPMDDSVVANVALLVDEAGRGALERRLELLDEDFQGHLHFRCVGPLPPYSFATVEAQVPSFELVDEARRRLGLGEAVTPDEIKRAYRRQGRQLHPDVNREDPEADAHMAELTRAYDLLLAYAESQAREAENARAVACRFDRQTVERTVLIGVRSQQVAA